MNVLNTFLLVAFPYVAVIVFAVGVVYRYRQRGFTVSSLSSQFLEGRQLFWGTVPFHIGILVVFAGHLIAFLLPQATLAWNRIPVRLITLEVTGFIFGLTVLVGLSPSSCFCSPKWCWDAGSRWAFAGVRRGSRPISHPICGRSSRFPRRPGRFSHYPGSSSSTSLARLPSSSWFRSRA